MTNTMSDTIRLGEDLLVLVTTGSSGIGLAIAETLANAGAQIHVCDISQQVLDTCATKHLNRKVSYCDVLNECKVSHLCSDVAKRYDGFDVLFNNAGIAGPTGSDEELSIESGIKQLM